MRINNLQEIPEFVLDLMHPLRELFLSEVCTLDFRNHYAVTPVLNKLNEHLKSELVSAFHCTREPVAGWFSTEGLRKLDIGFHQKWFLSKYGSRFNCAELIEIQEAWKKYFGAPSNQKMGREGRLWFCFMPEMVAHGCENFFRFVGGEAIYKAIENPIIKAKLECIGRPVVVEVSLLGPTSPHIE